MLGAVGKAWLTWGVAAGGLGAIPASVCAGYSPGLRREDGIHSPGYPAAPPLHPAGTTAKTLGRSPLSPAAPPRPNERPRRLGTVPPTTPSPPAGWWARPGGQPPTHGTRNHCLPGFGIRDLGSAPLAPAAVFLGGAVLCKGQFRKPASATAGSHNGHSGGRKATCAPAHTEPRACPPSAQKLQFPATLARPPCRGALLPSGGCSKTTRRWAA